jgi:hypothetical protein
MPIMPALIVPSGQCDIVRLVGWFELLILHTHQI